MKIMEIFILSEAIHNALYLKVNENIIKLSFAILKLGSVPTLRLEPHDNPLRNFL